MKFIHTSDLHLGKRVNEFPMIEDQRFILNKMLEIIDREAPDAVLIAGDVYDKPFPPVEAVNLLSDFLGQLIGRGLEVFITSGNHDSSDRLAFGADFFDVSGLHISRPYDRAGGPDSKTTAAASEGTPDPDSKTTAAAGCITGSNARVASYTLTDEHGPVNVFLLPFLKPITVRQAFPDETIESYTDAVRTAVEHLNINTGERNVLVAHQFVTGASRSESEEGSVGGLDNVDASAFEGFDYVALGHIHGPQNIGGTGSPDTETDSTGNPAAATPTPARIRYSGTPLKYSFSEKDHEKSLTIVELGEKGSIAVRTEALVPLHDMREIRGLYEDLMNKKSWEGTRRDDYLRVILEDEEDVLNAMTRLRTTYPNIMKLEYDNTRTRTTTEVGSAEAVERKSERELFEELFRLMNGRDCTGEESQLVEQSIE